MRSIATITVARAPGSRDFAERYGLGMMTFSEQEQEAFAGDAGGEEFVDPNQEYVESLSDSEREAYFQALHGTSRRSTNRSPRRR